MALFTGTDPMQFQRTMIFVDGTNLFYRLEAANLVIEDLAAIFYSFAFVSGGRQISRTYLYTIQEHLDRAFERHGANLTNKVRVVRGHGIRTRHGNVKEKAVDALLVADLIYHAASRNYDYAVLVSVDTDFVHAIRRVEDFGFRTSVIGICSEVPDRLIASSDDHFVISRDNLINAKLAKEATARTP
jgi:uncharacterized LabA/DUF88 family protein